jgi:3-phosphoshikimate 1-carboxyvinyltransferase
MRESSTPTRKVVGEVRVPGERVPAERALLLAALAEGESRVGYVPPSAGRVVDVLVALGIETKKERGGFVVVGKGLRGFSPADGILDLEGLEESALLVLAILAGQNFVTRVKLGVEVERAVGLLAQLAQMGMPAQQETESVYSVGKGEPVAVAFTEVDIAAADKLALLVAGLFVEGTTVLPETAKNRNRMERLLRQRGVTVSRRRNDEQYIVSVEGGQAVESLDVEVAGDLDLAYPFILPALVLKGSKLTLKSVAVRSGQRHFLELLRQIGAELELEDLGEDTYDLRVKPSELKSTRVAGQRAEKLIGQVALLAVLATQVPGEVVIRDIEPLRQGPFDKVAHLFESLRALQVRVGEFPEGLVVKGGFPVHGGELDARDDAELAIAFAVAGMWAEGEILIDNTECVASVYPDFFKALAALKEKRR